ncbi:glycosyltransferase [Thermaurantiacus sp.]
MGLLPPDSREVPRVSIIVPHLNTPEHLVRALQALARQEIDRGGFEIIVVDNGSRIPLDPVMAAWPEVRFLVEREAGPGPARNLGANAARAAILAFVDADVRVLPGWLMAGLEALAAHPDGPIGGDVRISVDDPRHMSGVEAFETVFAFQQRKLIERQGYSVTANMMMTRQVFEAIGPFGGLNVPEDMEFGQRGRARGHPTRYAPAMRALHPARRNFDDMAAKWHRLAVQALTAHQAAGKPMWMWDLRALVVAASAVPHGLRLLGSPRIEGLPSRLKGLAFLYRIRWARAMDMLALSRATRHGEQVTAAGWNA